MAIMAPSTTQNNRGGNGRYTPIRRRANQKKQEEVEYLDRHDTRMRFKNSKDPVYVAFDYLDRQPLSQLAADFVKDSLHDIMFFVSRMK